MLEVGWSEILVIALVLIIVVGPKELPGMLRTFGKMASRLRTMANEFKGQFDEALREAELDDVRKGISEVNKLNPTNTLRDAINPLRQLGQDIKSDLQKASDISLRPDAPAGAGQDAEESSDIVEAAEAVLTKPAVAAHSDENVAVAAAPVPAAKAEMPATSATASAATASAHAGASIVTPVAEAAKPKATRKKAVAETAAKDNGAAARTSVRAKKASDPVAAKSAEKAKVAAKKAKPAVVDQTPPRNKAAKAGDA